MGWQRGPRPTRFIQMSLNFPLPKALGGGKPKGETCVCSSVMRMTRTDMVRSRRESGGYRGLEWEGGGGEGGEMRMQMCGGERRHEEIQQAIV